MYLHEDREMFRTIVEQVAEESGKNSIVIEKDYYVTMILRLLSEQLELCVFKGGTSLSKGFHVINRFSEDIDLNVQSEKKPSESKRKQLKANITKIISDLDFGLTNADSIKSRRDYNRYIIDYPSSLSAAYLKEQLIKNGKRIPVMADGNFVL